MTGRSFAFTVDPPIARMAVGGQSCNMCARARRKFSVVRRRGGCAIFISAMLQAPILIISGTNRPASNALRVAGILKGHYERLGVAHEVLSLEELPKEVF